MKTLGELLKELDKDNTYLKAMALKKSVPKGGEIPVDLASTLQTQCWLMTSDISTLHTRVAYYANKMERVKEDTLNDKKRISEEKSEAAKERNAKCTNEYRLVADEYAVAKVLLNDITSLKKFFDNGIYTNRSRQDKEARDWQSAPTSELK